MPFAMGPTLPADFSSAPEPLLARRALLVFAHADDETIALGGRLHRLNITRLIHVTDGAPRDEHDSREHGFASLEDYRIARAAEFRAMLQMAGADGISHDNLGVPDQHAAFELAALTRSIAGIIEADAPEVILTHPYEGGHPDHDACAFAVHHAVQIAQGRTPKIIECAFYHAGPQGIETGVFLHEGSSRPAVLELSPGEQRLKQRLLDCYATQRETLQYFPTDRESFRLAPEYDFSQPPHPGRLFYEDFPWGMTAELFCQLVLAARQDLIPEALASCL